MRSLPSLVNISLFFSFIYLFYLSECCTLQLCVVKYKGYQVDEFYERCRDSCKNAHWKKKTKRIVQKIKQKFLVNINASYLSNVGTTQYFSCQKSISKNMPGTHYPS